MDEDNDIFEMFLETLNETEDEEGRVRILSKNPRHSADDPATSKPKRKHIER